MTLDFSSLERALASLGRAIERSIREPSDEEVRDAVIQRFEYSYELSWKMLKRQLEQELPNPGDADRMSFAELMREGSERGLVARPERWLSYRYQRNITLHVYDEAKARTVHAAALEFLTDARALLTALVARGNHNLGS
ncbi:MAG TPA: nucleotidyltransferase substrate binding protein [Polyangiaceae bacterium]